MDALHSAQVDIVGFAAILEAIETAAQDAAFALAVGLEDLVVEIGDKLAYGRSLFGVDVPAPEDGGACGLAAGYAIEPVLHLPPALPHQNLFVDVPRAMAGDLRHDDYRPKDR